VQTVSNSIDFWPLVVLGICLCCIVLLITKFRVHAFIALFGVGILAGGLAKKLPEDPSRRKPTLHWVRAVELTAEGFGKTAGKIGMVIALAAAIGVCLVESGAADKIVRRFLGFFGEARAPNAIFTSGYIISIPIFFETYFMLLLPLVQSIHLRTKRSYLLYVLAICCGGSITHSLVPPHPGPLAMAENFHLDIGKVIVCGILAGIGPVLCAWAFSKWISARLNPPMRNELARTALNENLERPESELPSLLRSLLPILLPLGLIGGVSALEAFGADPHSNALLAALFLLGERHVALLVGTLFAMHLLASQKGFSMAQVSERVGHALAMAGVVILIASAGGSFGAMLREAGVGSTITALARTWNMNLVFLAWAVSAIIRIAQGSATVAMISASAIMAGVLADGHPLPHHPMYLYLAVAFGSKTLSWMNDAGFWTFSRFGGFTESETLRSWSVLVTIMSVTGLIQCLILSKLLPFSPQ
jgi:GntP family gluconate:H+ symporter